MTKKDFNAIAAVIASVKYNCTVESRDELVLKTTAEWMADMLYRTNPRFDRDRFMTACGF